MMAGLKDALGNVFLGLASSLRSKGRPVGLMRLTGSGYGQRCNINPYHIYVVMSHRSRDNENYVAPPNTDICLSATSMTVVEGVSEVVETLRLKWGIPFVSVRNADVDGEYWLNARKVVTVFPIDANRCCVKTGKFRINIVESADSLAERIDKALCTRR